jgi:hypothetical protein
MRRLTPHRGGAAGGPKSRQISHTSGPIASHPSLAASVANLRFKHSFTTYPPSRSWPSVVVKHSSSAVRTASQGRFAEAEPLLVDGYNCMTGQTEEIPFEFRSTIDRTLQQIVQMYDRWEKPEKAAAWRNKQIGTQADRTPSNIR